MCQPCLLHITKFFILSAIHWPYASWRKSAKHSNQTLPCPYSNPDIAKRCFRHCISWIPRFTGLKSWRSISCSSWRSCKILPMSSLVKSTILMITFSSGASKPSDVSHDDSPQSSSRESPNQWSTLVIEYLQLLAQCVSNPNDQRKARLEKSMNQENFEFHAPNASIVNQEMTGDWSIDVPDANGAGLVCGHWAVIVPSRPVP